ncbi:hypothetical protein [Streptomyces orinoci]|uniref:SseB protein N-terminal domain-containing protein n=1 Tax=Streptomyces orinoci TaxID=67339 RepID=A0ABV3JYQ4_STRON|nr:hypothetical protein [Streptomyces orinoci]
MNDNGGGGKAPVQRSKIAEYTEMTSSPRSEGRQAPGAEVEARRQEFTARLAAFRATAVLVPYRDDGWLTADFGGVRWILAFSDEAALARYALAREEGHREWTYQTVLGARLLEAAVPAAGVPCGVALDAADGPQQALLLPPVAGIVPDSYAVNRGFMGDGRVTNGEETRW